MFRNRIAIGREGFPFNLSDRRYDDGLCPVTEAMHEHKLLGFEPCAYSLNDAELDILVAAIRKVHAARDELRTLN